MSRQHTQAERNLLASSHVNYHAVLEVEDSDGVWRNASNLGGFDFFHGAKWGKDVDTRTVTGTITLKRSTHGVTLSPTMGASPVNRDASNAYVPFLKAGRRFRLRTAVSGHRIAPAATAWRTVWRGKIDRVKWAQDPIVLQCRDDNAWLLNAFLKDETVYATPEGVLREDAMRQILATVPIKHGAPALYVDLPAGAPLAYVRQWRQDKTNVYDAVRSVALNVGRDVEYQWFGADEYRLTYFQPERDVDPATAAPDFVFGPNEYLDVTELEEGDEEVRNWVRVTYTRADGRPGEARYVNQDSVEEYGELFAESKEGATNNIDTQEEADALASAIAKDLGFPLASKEIKLRYFPLIELGDLCRFLPNGVHYDTEQSLACVGWRHELENGGGRTFVRTQGRVIGAYREWTRRITRGVTRAEEDVYAGITLPNFREVFRDDARGIVTFEMELGPRTDAIYQFLTVAETDADTSSVDPETVPDQFWPGPNSRPERIYKQELTNPFRITVPMAPDGRVHYFQFEARARDATAGELQRHVIGPPAVERPLITNVEDAPGSAPNRKDLFCTLKAEGGRGGVLRAWVARESAADASADGPPDGVLDVAATPYDVTPGDLFAVSGGTAPLFDEIRLNPLRGKRVHLEFVDSADRSSGVVDKILTPTSTLVDETDALRDAAITRARQVAATLSVPGMLGDLTTPPEAGVTFGVYASDGRLYRWTGSAWVPVVRALDMSGQVITAQIADAALTTAKFAAGITPVEQYLTGSLPGGDTSGRVAVGPDGKLYRGSASGWTAAVQTVDIVGTLATAQLADAAITTAKLAVAAVDSTRLADAAVLAAKLASGAVTATALADNAVTSTKITDGAILTPKLAAGAVTAATIAANAVTSDKIIAGAVTAGKLYSGSVQADLIQAINLAAGSIVAEKLAAGAVTAAAIAALTITGDKIAANAISADKILANAVTSDKILANAITAGKLAAGAINAAELFVGGVVGSTAIADGAIVTAKLFVGAVTADRIAANAVTAAKIEAGAVTADKLAANSVTAATIAAGVISAFHLASISVEVGKYIRSSGYVPGVAGWNINGDGGAEFNNVTVRGTVYASGGTFTGTVYASGGTFAGSLSGATGTFGGVVQVGVGGGGGVDLYSGGTLVGSMYGLSRVAGVSGATRQYYEWTFTVSGTEMMRLSGASPNGTSAGLWIWDGDVGFLRKVHSKAPDGAGHRLLYIHQNAQAYPD